MLKTAEEWLKTGDTDSKTDEYQRKLSRLINHELVILQTFGFDIKIDHPNRFVNRAVDFLRLPAEVGQVIDFFTTNSLYLTTFCVEMTPEVIAASCVYLVLQWSGYEVGLSTDNRKWWTYLSHDLNQETLTDNVKRYLKLFKGRGTQIRNGILYLVQSKGRSFVPGFIYIQSMMVYVKMGTIFFI